MTKQKPLPKPLPESIKRLVNNAINYPNCRENQLSDNYSNLNLETAAHLIGWTQKQVLEGLKRGGALAPYFSLEDRDTCRGCERSYPSDAMMYMSIELVNAHFDEEDALKGDGLEKLSVEALQALLAEEKAKAEEAKAKAEAELKAKLIAEIRSLRGA